jgi:hypothetical protein
MEFEGEIPFVRRLPSTVSICAVILLPLLDRATLIFSFLRVLCRPTNPTY